jgi:gamma-glutamyltranspeptidase / glutathione hydrolase
MQKLCTDPRVRAASVCLICLWTISSVAGAKLFASGQGSTPVASRHAMVVAQEPLAAEVGLRVLRDGGNAVDSAIATAFALAVTHPVAGNLGGGGFMLIRLANGQTTFLDFRERAPRAAQRNMYLDPSGKPTDNSIYGWTSAGVPGTVSGLALAHKKFGTKPWKSLVLPASQLASGFTVSQALAESLASAESLKHDPESQRIFRRNGSPYRAGDTLRQPELHDTLDRISTGGAEEFYRGETARRFEKAMASHGGLITAEDLKDYQTVERKPLEGDFKDFHIITAPPPSAGGIGLLQMVGMLEGTGFEVNGPDSPKAIHYEAEAMRRAYADRSEYLGDPDFFNVPTKQLLDPRYLAWRSHSIDPDHATPSDLVTPGLPHSVDARLSRPESPQTTHFNVVDEQGNAVALTYTLNNSWGNGITVPGLGFLLNDEMDDFVAKPGSPNLYGLVGGEANAIEAGKRPLSSMTPTIVLKNGKLFMLAGAPGGSRITTGVTQVILNVLAFGMSAQQAVDLPRFHQQWKPDYLYLEDGFTTPTRNALAKMGYELRPIDSVARVEAIVIRNGVLEGGTRARNFGKIASY